MSKDPAFLFYTSDFLTGVTDLTMEERGQFISLLCLQHQKGHLTKKMIDLCVGNAAADVMAKFRQDSAGLWYSPRLDEEIKKRAEHSEKQRKRALDGWEERRKKKKEKPHPTADATALPLENEDVNENRIEDKDRKEGVEEREGIIYTYDSEIFRANWLAWRTILRDKHDKDYFNREAEQSALIHLSRISKSEDHAIQTIQKALRNGWQDLYTLKIENNGNQNNGLNHSELDELIARETEKLRSNTGQKV